MKRIILSFLSLALSIVIAEAQDFSIKDAYVKKNSQLNQLVFTIEVEGTAGDSVPTPNGALDGAPVLGYVFPTTLKPTDVGFDSTIGIVALALTSHPDFDDTPLWDENNDLNYLNDGIEWHPHWVVLINDNSVPGGLSVKPTSANSILPPTNPGMPMYMDSPGYPVNTKNGVISCSVPLYRMNNQVDFQYDAVTALMKVNTTDTTKPLLGVYEVYSIGSGNLSLPYSIGNHSTDTLFIDISTATGIGLVDPETVAIYPNPAFKEITIDLTPGLTMGTHEVTISSITGTTSYQSIINGSTMQIPVSDIGSTGTYVVSIIDISTGETKGSKFLVIK